MISGLAPDSLQSSSPPGCKLAALMCCSLPRPELRTALRREAVHGACQQRLLPMCSLALLGNLNRVGLMWNTTLMAVLGGRIRQG